MDASQTRPPVRTLGGAFRPALLATVACVALWSAPVLAETMNGALAKAYVTNPDINAQRATVRQTDESVPTANALLEARPTTPVTTASPATASLMRRETPSLLVAVRVPSTESIPE